MEQVLTELEKGVFVYIDEVQLEVLKNKSGFLSRETYPEFYEDLALENELGRFLIFRFLKLNK